MGVCGRCRDPEELTRRQDKRWANTAPWTAAIDTYPGVEREIRMANTSYHGRSETTESAPSRRSYKAPPTAWNSLPAV